MTDRPDAPFGPLTGLFPFFNRATLAVRAGRGDRPAWPCSSSCLEIRHWRQTAGATRAKYSG